MNGLVECPQCGGVGEVPTTDTAHLVSTRVSGFEHPNLQFTRCYVCNGTGHVTHLGAARAITEGTP